MAHHRRHRAPKRRRRTPPGAAPGTLVIDPDAASPVIRMMAYGPDGFTEADIRSPDELLPLIDTWPVLWVNVDGLGDEAVLLRLAEIFRLHPLALEDVVSTGQRAKVEPYAEDLFVVARMPAQGHDETEQLSLLLGRRFVLTFQERAGDCLDGVRERIRHGRGRIRRMGADYLIYALLDAVVDSYFPELEKIGDELEAIEDEILLQPDFSSASNIHRIKRRLVALRRAIGPHREAINSLLRDTGDVISQETGLFLRDCYDHVVRLIEQVESYRDLTSDLLSIYLSRESNRMNEVMKVLTIIATIFIPLSFIAGLYGMNFNTATSPWNLPELDWYYGYPLALALMAAVAGGLVVFFKKKGWFG